jgi:hypothetical protein
VKFLAIPLISLALIACGGGTEPFASPPIGAIKAAAPSPVKKATTITGGNAVVIHLYQALYGMAPSNALLVDYAFQSNNDASLFARNLTDRFATTNHADLAKLVLENLRVTATTVPAINAKGESEYALLADAVKQLFAAYPTMRGQVILNMTNLLAGLESDATYGAAAAAFNNQAFVNYDSSMNDGVSLFSPTPILLPDLRAKYDLLCGSEVMVQNAISIDLNGDGKSDLVFNLWCRHVPAGEEYIGPAINSLVALVQDSMGTFSDKTREIFGTDIVDIGGSGYGYVVADFNGDGHKDIVFAVNKEDGRNPADIPASNMKSQAVSFISDGKGHYTQIRFGIPRWGDDAKLVKNQAGIDQLLLLPADSSAELWTYDGGWKQSGGYDWIQKNPVLFSPENTSMPPSMVVSKFNNGTSLEVWKLENSVWTRKIEYPYFAPIRIPLTSTSGAAASTNIFRIDGGDYIDYGGLYEGCSLKRTKAGPTEVVYSFLGVPIPGGYTGQAMYDRWTPPTLKIVALGVSSQSINPNPVTLTTDALDANFYHMSCLDLNGDGVDDIFIRTTGTPLIYVNNGAGKFGRLALHNIPKAPRGASHIYSDITGDGISDLLYFPIDRWQFELGEYGKVQFLLYKGNRNITQSDLMFSE